MPQEIADRPRLLIAEDDAALAETLRDVLEEDFTVDIAADGSEAVARVHDSRPDLVVLDAQMPRLDGFAACRLLRHDPRTVDLPIIMVTGDSQPELAAAAFAAGASDYLARPFSVSQLRARAATCLMRHHAS
jgi:DNA-binding response OmpR family regulator